MADIGEAGDSGDVVHLDAHLERRVRVGELEDTVPPLRRGSAPLVSQGGTRSDVKAEVSRFLCDGEVAPWEVDAAEDGLHVGDQFRSRMRPGRHDDVLIGV